MSDGHAGRTCGIHAKATDKVLCLTIVAWTGSLAIGINGLTLTCVLHLDTLSLSAASWLEELAENCLCDQTVTKSCRA